MEHVIVAASHDAKYIYDEQGSVIAVYSQRQCKWFAVKAVRQYAKISNASCKCKDSIGQKIVWDVQLTDAQKQDMQRFEPEVAKLVI